MRNRYQALEEKEPVAEEDKVERNFEITRKTSTEVAETILGRARGGKSHWLARKRGVSLTIVRPLMRRGS